MQIDNPKELNFILGHSHFIKTVEVPTHLDEGLLGEHGGLQQGWTAV